MIETVEVAPHMLAFHLAKAIVNSKDIRSFDGLSLDEQKLRQLILQELKKNIND